LFGLSKKMMDDAQALNEYFVDALKLYAFDNNENAGFAALTAAKVAAFEQRQGMVAYSQELAADATNTNPSAADAINHLLNAINEKDWSILDITHSKRALAELDKQMLNALQSADAIYFRNAYPEFFEDFYSKMVAPRSESVSSETTKIKPQTEPQRQKQDQGVSIEMETQINGKVKVIIAPQKAYFNRDIIVDYRYGLGELIDADTVFVRFVDHADCISIKTSKPSVISKVFLDNGQRISSSGQNICKITELDHYDYRQLLEKRKKHEQAVKSEPGPDSRSKPTQITSGTRNVEIRLKDLKKLYEKKLITKTVYEKKQDEILLDL